MEDENCRLGRKRHNPVSSIHVRASSNVRAPCPFWRILSARDASNCSAVKEKPHFQAGVTAKPVMLRPVLASSKGCRIRLPCRLKCCGFGVHCPSLAYGAGIPLTPGRRSIHLSNIFQNRIKCDGRLAGSLSTSRAKRWDGRAGNWLGVRFWPVPAAATPSVWDRARY